LIRDEIDKWCLFTGCSVRTENMLSVLGKMIIADGTVYSFFGLMHMGVNARGGSVVMTVKKLQERNEREHRQQAACQHLVFYGCVSAHGAKIGKGFIYSTMLQK
jgi:hypothetical protein